MSVAQLNRLVAEILEGNVPIQRVRGEISNLVRAASGHWYFTLKDSAAQVRAVMFRGRAQQVGFVPREGMLVEVRAQVTLYQARGDFQLLVDSMRQAGAGDLYQQFLMLKDKLQKEGLFEADRKRPLPVHPSAIGVITSPAGAALHDVLTTLRRRAPAIPVFVFPTLVQGAEAPARLLAALAAAQLHGDCSVLLLVRGGGSIEDLWAFNDERLARAIAASQIPVVSGVGHETDFTIADFVADARAPTPTAAAALVAPDRREALAQVQRLVRALAQAWQAQMYRREQQLDYAARLLRPPSAQWRERQALLVEMARRLQAAWSGTHKDVRHQLERLQHRLVAPELMRRGRELDRLTQVLQAASRRRLDRDADNLTQLSERLRLASPQATLERGYAIVRTAQGAVLRSRTQASAGDAIEVLLADGALDARVEVKVEGRVE